MEKKGLKTKGVYKATEMRCSFQADVHENVLGCAHSSRYELNWTELA